MAPPFIFQPCVKCYRLCISATDRDIGMNEKPISMARFPPSFEHTLTTKLLISFEHFARKVEDIRSVKFERDKIYTPY